MSVRLAKAAATVREAEAALEKTLRADYPKGALVSWLRNDRLFTGTIVEFGYGARVLVRNERTTRPYWIYASDIVAATNRRSAA